MKVFADESELHNLAKIWPVYKYVVESRALD